MKSKSILFVLAVCVGMQFGLMFGSQEAASSGQSKGWFSSLSSYVPESVKRAYRNSYIGGTTRSPKTEIDSLRNLTATAFFGGSVAVVYKEMAQELLTLDPKAQAYIISVLAIVSYGLSELLVDQLEERYLSVACKTIELMLSDPVGYPTWSSKMHALLKNNEFIFVDTKQAKLIDSGKDAYLTKACEIVSKKLMRERANMPKDKRDEAKAHDDRIDKAISDFRGMVYRISSLEDQIEYLKGYKSVNVLNEKELQALNSLLWRAERQKLVEQLSPGRFAETSRKKFYTLEEGDVIPGTKEEREANWNKKLAAAKQKTNALKSESEAVEGIKGINERRESLRNIKLEELYNKRLKERASSGE